MIVAKAENHDETEPCGTAGCNEEEIAGRAGDLPRLRVSPAVLPGKSGAGFGILQPLFCLGSGGTDPALASVSERIRECRRIRAAWVRAAPVKPSSIRGEFLDASLKASSARDYLPSSWTAFVRSPANSKFPFGIYYSVAA
jgi:hypothetical protein